MKRERIVEFVGGNEEETAYLRLQLRKSARELLDTWRLRREGDSHVDLLVVDDIGDGDVPMPVVGAGAGQRRVRLIDPAFGAAGMESVAWPLSQDTIVALLNKASRAAAKPQPAALPVIQHNVYDDLFEPDSVTRWQSGVDTLAQLPMEDFLDAWVAPTRESEAALTDEAEQLFRREIEPSHKEILKSIRLRDDVDVEATDGKTVGAGARQERRDAIGASSHTMHTLAVDEANARHSLLTYLTGRLLPGPARIEACHVVLTVDPRNRMFYAKGGLCIFEDCCTQALRRGDWQGLSASDFEVVKQQLEARPYSQLLWLCSYLANDAVAAAALPADGRYRLMQTFELQRDYPRAARIAQALQQRTTLAAAAAAARVSVAEAQRVAAAFDAVGFLIPD